MEIRYTGHAFVDVGLACIVAMAGKLRLGELIADDLATAANKLKDNYCHYPIVQNYISVIFTNSHFVQSAKTLEQKAAYADEVLFLYQYDRFAEQGDVRCAYFPQFAAVETAYRHHIPLLNGVGIGNFGGRGQAGLPVSGLALLAIHAMPLGCYKVGHLLAFHQLINPNDESSGDLMEILVEEAYRENQKAISMMPRGEKAGEMPTYGSYPKSRFVDGLIWARQRRRDESLDSYNITGYYFTNYGPSPSIEILQLDNNVLDFVMQAANDHADAWWRATHNNWVRPKKEKDAPISTDSTARWKNKLYESLFNLYADTSFRRFLWMIASGRSWNLIELALRKVLLMDQERIDTYRELADRLVDYAMHHEKGVEQSFYYKFSRARTYEALRRVLRGASEKVLKAESEHPLMSYEDFIMAFEHPSEEYHQWRLARDLIAIRMLEGLHKQNIPMDELPEDEYLSEEEE